MRVRAFGKITQAQGRSGSLSVLIRRRFHALFGVVHMIHDLARYISRCADSCLVLVSVFGFSWRERRGAGYCKVCCFLHGFSSRRAA